MDKVLVTGCAGFIGSRFCRLLLEKGFEVTGIDNFDPFYSREIKENNLASLTSFDSFSFYELDITHGLQSLPEDSFSAVVHLAAKAGVRPSIADPGAYIHTNIIGTQKVHEFMIDRGIKKLVFASSSSVYGNNKKVPFQESDPVDNPISPYAFTKKAGELMNYTLHSLYDTDVINLRFFTVYGPGQRPDLAIHKFVRLVQEGQPLSLYGNGETARDYTYIDDITSGIFNALQFCLNNNNVYEILNLGNSKPVKLSDLVHSIYQCLDVRANIRHVPMQAGDVDITFADISRANTVIGYAPATDLQTGLNSFVKWYKSKR